MTDKNPTLYFDLHLFVCTNERPEGHPRGSCSRAGAEGLLKYLRSRAREAGVSDIRVNQAGCLDRCELGPVLVLYPVGIWYKIRSEADIDEIITRHLLAGEVVDRLVLTPEDGPKKKKTA